MGNEYGAVTKETTRTAQRSVSGGHKLIMESRRDVKLTGVNKVISFEPDLVLLNTDTGRLKITGKEMHIINLDIEKGLLDLNGKIDCLCYMASKDDGLFSLKRLFK